MLRALHATPAPTPLPPLDYLPQLCAVRAGRMAASPLLAAIERARVLPHVDVELVVSLVAYIKATAGVLEPYSDATLVHGDLTFENVLWDGTDVTALIDFEFSRGAPSDVDLDVLLRFCAFPYLHVAEDYAEQTTASDYVEVPYWMRDDYPELFARPHVLDRLRLYSIGFDLQQLLAMPPTASMRQLSEHHPLRRLARTIAQRSYLDTFAHGEHF
jgi:aminoglycoside phosphotransferase (APT) family kinase protein